MIIAHLPAGFLLSRHLLRHHRGETYFISFLLVGMFASIAPDLDMFYHYLVDQQRHGHHSYWTHIPFFWVTTTLVFLLPALLMNKRRAVLLLLIILAGGLCHSVLDSLTSGIKWLYPVDTHYYGLWRKFDISARYQWWVWNYVFHWSFLLEVMICLYALITLLRDRLLCSQLMSFLTRAGDRLLAVTRRA